MLDAGMSLGRYRIVVQGELGPRYNSAFERMDYANGETEIVGPIVDPSHLQGLLERIAGLGLTLRSVTAVERDTSPAVGRRVP